MQPHQIVQLVNRRQHRQTHRQKSASQRLKRSALGCGALFSLALVLAVVAFGVLFASLTVNLPSLATLPVLLDAHTGQLLQPTLLYDRSGLHPLYALENPGISRHYLPLDPNLPEHLSPQLVHATVALLDPSFWQNPGFAWRSLSNPEPVTLAERLVNDLLVNQEPHDLEHALRMRLLAAQLVAHYGRSQVLEWYLNSAYFGHLAYGADSAARLYLAQPASQLDFAQSAVLLAALEAPALNPLDAPTAARERQQDMLGRLFGRGVITSQEYANLKEEPVEFAPAPHQPSQPAQAFSSLVISQLIERFGRSRIERGGLQVITTLDYDLQLQVTCALRSQLNHLEGHTRPIQLPDGSACEAERFLPTQPPSDPPLPSDLMGSAIIIDPQNGQILAMLGDATLKDETPVVSSHDPGSLLTPFVAVAGFARGFGPASLVWDVPASLPDSLSGRQNPDSKFHGPQRLRLAIANDYLVPLSQLLTQIGAVNVWRFNEPLGLTRLAGSQNPSDLLFSGGEMTLPELAEAYSAFPNLGSQSGQRSEPDDLIQPGAVLAVKDLDGRQLYDGSQSETQAVLSQPLAYLVHNILSDETARWPSLGYPNALEIGIPSGGKVGQVAGRQQVWTAGYTQQRLAITWLGLPAGTSQNVQLDPKMVAGIWHAIIQYANRDLPSTNWSLPLGVSAMAVCDPSGQLPTQDCPTVVNEVFLDGNEPTALDSLYRVFQVNRETGMLATVFTPLEMIDDRTYLVFPPEYKQWAEALGQPQPPVDYDAILPPAPLPGAQITSPTLFAYLHGKIDLLGSASGDGFVSYHIQFGQGLNPRTWQQIGPEVTQAVTNARLATWDTTGLDDGLYALRLVVVRQNQHFDTAILQVTVDNTPPLVKITYPSPDQLFSFPNQRLITLLADVQETVSLQTVDWFVDGEKIGETSQAPYSLPWVAGIGEHSLVVNATDLAGNVGESKTVKILVK